MDLIIKKIKMKIDKISYLQCELKNYEILSKDDILTLLQNYEKTTRDEMSSYFEKYFKDDTFADILLKIANKYKENKRIHIYIISSLGNMVNRYNLKETKEIYEYFKKYMFEKGISAYVAIYLPHFKNFQKEENKWDYFMKIAKMTPKKIAEINFLAILNEYIEEVPDEYKQEIIDFLKEKYQMANNEGGKKYYQDMINRINFNF
jgi:hypothetical protein